MKLRWERGTTRNTRNIDDAIEILLVCWWNSFPCNPIVVCGIVLIKFEISCQCQHMQISQGRYFYLLLELDRWLSYSMREDHHHDKVAFAYWWITSIILFDWKYHYSIFIDPCIDNNVNMEHSRTTVNFYFDTLQIHCDLIAG